MHTYTNISRLFLRSFQSKLLLSPQLRQSYSSRKSVIAFFLHIISFGRRKKTIESLKQKKRCDKIGLFVSLRVSFPFMSFALPFIPSVTYGI